MHLTHPKYRPDIDGLRAIAVLSVVGFHAFPGKITGGFIGVDIFFVISGFLISTIIFGSLERNRFSFVEFYSRRIRRIFPPLLVVLVAAFAYGWFSLLADEYKQLGKHIAGGAGFVSNFVLLDESGYFDYDAKTKPLLHLWSLAIEEQFYIFWPLLLAFVWKRNWSFLRITLIITAVSFATSIYLIQNYPTAVFYLPISRFWELMVGGLLAYISLHKPELIGNYKNTQSIFGFALIALGFMLINEERAFPGWWALLPTLGTFFIISAGPDAWLNRNFLSAKLIVGIGLISYPLYLWHWPLLAFARIEVGASPSFEIRLAAVCISIVFAWLTFKLVEKPIRFGRYANAKSNTLLVLMVVLGLVGYDLYNRGGYIHRKLSNEASLNITAFEWPKEKNKTKACVNIIKTTDIPYCLITEGKEPTAALIGDSHANAIFDALNAEIIKKGGGLIMLGKHGCPPFLGVERDKNDCPKVMNETVSYITNNPGIKDVIIAGRFALTLTGIGREMKKNRYSLTLVDNPSVTDRDKIFEMGLERILKKLSYNNKRITIVLDVPELNFDPRSCLRMNEECTIKYDMVEKRQMAYTAIIRKLKSKYDFNVVDLKKAFCRDELCIAKSNDKVLYRDDHHLGTNGNTFLTNSGFEFLQDAK